MRVGGVLRGQKIERPVECDAFAVGLMKGELAGGEIVEIFVERANLAGAQRADPALGVGQLEPHVTRALEAERAGDEVVAPGFEILAVGDGDGLAGDDGRRSSGVYAGRGRICRAIGGRICHFGSCRGFIRDRTDQFSGTVGRRHKRDGFKRLV